MIHSRAPTISVFWVSATRASFSGGAALAVRAPGDRHAEYDTQSHGLRSIRLSIFWTRTRVQTVDVRSGSVKTDAAFARFARGSAFGPRATHSLRSCIPSPRLCGSASAYIRKSHIPRTRTLLLL
jgi:hypothetical protein